MIRLNVVYPNGRLVNYYADRIESRLEKTPSNEFVDGKNQLVQNESIVVALMRVSRGMESVDTLWFNPRHLALVSSTVIPDHTIPPREPSWQNNATTRIIRRHSSPEAIALMDAGQRVEDPGCGCPTCLEIIAEQAAIWRELDPAVHFGLSKDH